MQCLHCTQPSGASIAVMLMSSSALLMHVRKLALNVAADILRHLMWQIAREEHNCIWKLFGKITFPTVKANH